jgi:hypothetical protein
VRHATILVAIAIAIAINQSAATGQGHQARRPSPGLCPAGGCPNDQTTAPATPTWPATSSAAAAAAGDQAICQVTIAVGSARSTTSGVYLTPNLILTVAHVFGDGRGPITITSPAGEVQVGILRRLDAAKDLAAIGVSSKHPTPRKLARQPPTRHATIHAAGYGKSGKLRIWTGRVLGWVTRRLTARADTMVISGQANSGDSGGPIFDAAGDVVGIIWGSADGNTYAVDLTTITTFLGPRPRAEPTDVAPAQGAWIETQKQLADLQILTSQLSAQLAALQTRGAPIAGPPGPPGPGGPPGPQGPGGAPPIGGDRQPAPITVRILAANGKTIKAAAVRPGDTITLSLVPVTP